MAVIEVDGNLSERMSLLLNGDRGPLWLALGLYQTMTFSLGTPFFGALSGTNLDLPASGSRAMTGTFNSASLMEVGGDNMFPLVLEGFEVDAASLFTLVSRGVNEVQVQYQSEVLLEALNAQAAQITGSANADTISPSSLLHLRKADHITALDGNDTVSGGRGADTISGGAGNDSLVGDDGADNISGGSGSDRLRGGNGTDLLAGSGGRDVITGGGGADVFRFVGTTGTDRITDFQDGLDRIDLAGSYTVEAQNNNSLIRHDGGTILFLGITPDQITTADFL